MFPNIHLPDSIATKATKYREMAHEGDEWRSPVFDIGSAKASSKLIAPKPITHKSPYQGTRATVNHPPERTTSSGPRGEIHEGGLSTTDATGRTTSGATADAAVGYTSLNLGGFEDASRSGPGDISGSGASAQGTNDYQPRTGTATDSVSTVVD